MMVNASASQTGTAMHVKTIQGNVTRSVFPAMDRLATIVSTASTMLPKTTSESASVTRVGEVADEMFTLWESMPRLVTMMIVIRSVPEVAPAHPVRTAFAASKLHT
jgi:uncharacterized membrane protein